MSQTKTVGPFTWKRRIGAAEESWELRVPGYFTHWAVKDYGGSPGPGFQGWKLVSGGPFEDAGAYNTREEAMEGVIPFLMQRVEQEIEERLAEAEALRAVLNNWRTQLKEGTT